MKAFDQSAQQGGNAGGDREGCANSTGAGGYLEWSGTDSQGNPVSGSLSLQVQDTFTMDTFTLDGVALSIDNANRRATGVVPVA